MLEPAARLLRRRSTLQQFLIAGLVLSLPLAVAVSALRSDLLREQSIADGERSGAEEIASVLTSALDLLSQVEHTDADVRSATFGLSRRAHELGDSSGLTLDPAMDTYYLGQVLIVDLPELVGVVGSTPMDSQRLSTLVRRIELRLDWKGAHPAVSFVTPPVLTLAATGPGQVARSELVDTMRRFTDQITEELTSRLQRRADRLTARRRAVDGVALVGLATALFVIGALYRAVAIPLRMVRERLVAVDAGEFGGPIPVVGRDEIAVITTALNRAVDSMRITQQALEREATHDPLTGLPNRASLHRELTAQHAAGVDHAALFIDLDRFKLVNDTYGHAAGDQLLVTVARRLDSLTTPGRQAYRLAGDEFVLLLTDRTDLANVEWAAEHVSRHVDGPAPLDIGREEFVVHVGLSIGAAVVRADSRVSAEDALRHADIALHEAKRRGRRCIVLFEPRLESALDHALGLRDELESAVERDQFVAYYQPIVHLASGRVVGLEALARWIHPRRGVLGPGSFLDAANESGLIGPIGERIIDQACGVAADLQATHAGLTINVNLSAEQLTAGMAATIRASLDRSGLAPERLCVEVVESSLLGDIEHGTRWLTAMRDLGVHIALDDFGTGYSSLSYLMRLPIDVVKVDRSFVRASSYDPTARSSSSILSAVSGLCTTLGLRTVVEGIESIDDLSRVSSLGFDDGQGFLFGRPMAAQMIEGALSAIHHRGSLTDASRLPGRVELDAQRARAAVIA